MPASRSRTERWRECLRQVHEREGALEITVPVSHDAGAGGGGTDLIWRVRMVGLSDTEIAVEQPSAAGRWMELSAGLRLIAVLAIGQNRWMFHTRILGVGGSAGGGVGGRTMRLAIPTTVERCQRRNFYRVSTAELFLPRVDCWPLLDPTTVVAAEVANRGLILDMANDPAPAVRTRLEEPLLLPEVGPRFSARLMNLGGGGVGLIIDPHEASAAERARLVWLRIDLTPTIPAPIALTARPVHTHIDSAQNLYAGLSFEWAFHPAHREFVVEQIGRYVEATQRNQTAHRIPA